jgi:hypothetical protein
MKPTNIAFACTKQTIRVWLRISLIAIVVAMALPAWAAPDVNGDGSVDFCDGVVFTADFFSNNLRSDFNNDGVVNLSDAAILAAVYCSGPAQSVVPGAATIGVYFDAAGTITQLVNVPASTSVTFYVVAHGVTDPAGMGGYTFQVTENSSAIITSDAPPPGFLANPGHSPAPDGKCALGSDTTCLGPAGPIVLNTYTLMFLGVDTTVEVVGLNDCSAPSASPSYVSCGVAGVPCDWTYFAYGASNGQAFITSQPVGVETESWSAVKAQYR